MGEIHYIEIYKESFTLWILTVCSIIAVIVFFERLIFLSKIKTNPEKFLQILTTVKDQVHRGQLKEAEATAENFKDGMSHLLKTSILHHGKTKEEMSELLTAARMEYKVLMENYLGILGTLGNAAPFIGLFGTVVGIIKSFQKLAVSGSAGPAVVSAGISEALVATAAGLLVAIPCVMVFNYFSRKIKEVSSGMEVACIRILVIFYGSR